MTPKYHQRFSLALLTDFYELSMAYGYYKLGIEKKNAIFHLFFRRKPFKGEYAVFAGLETVLDIIKTFRFDPSDIAYLSTIKNPKGDPFFSEDFLNYLSNFTFSLDIHAVEEGEIVFPFEPLLRVKGPVIEAQLLEGLLLNILNFQTLIATKASRITYAAGSDDVVEFGMRRAQGIDGSLSASRAAFIGGVSATSNVLAGKQFGIPVKGTLAHSWILVFKNEKEAFQAYVECYPDAPLFLVDTYDTIEGVKNAIEISKSRKGNMLGVRIDSGDLAYLSILVRKLLDENGFKDAKIMASNELDEFIIKDLKHQGAKVNYWGVGTNLVTAKDQPALDGVYKLTAIEDDNGVMQDRVKISEQSAKINNPGSQQIKRFKDENGFIADMIYDDSSPQKAPYHLVDSQDSSKERVLTGDGKNLLVPIFEKGKCVYTSPTLKQVQEKVSKNLSKLHASHRRFLNPNPYFVGIEKSLYQKKQSIILGMKNESSSNS